MHQSYRFSIIYFSIFGVLLLLSGATLFLSKLGLSYESVSTFYLGSAVQFSQPKSSYGLLETALPHLGAMGLFIFVTLHFMLFAGKKEKQKSVAPAIALFVAALLDIASGFMIVQGFSIFVWVKIVAFISLELLSLYLLYILFQNTLKSIAHYH